MQNASENDPARLLLNEISQENGPIDTERLRAMPRDERVKAAESVLRGILDHITEYEYDRGDGGFLDACMAAATRLTPTPDEALPQLRGLLHLIAVNVILLDARFKQPSMSRRIETDRFCSQIFEQSPVRGAVRAVYGPAAAPDVAFAQASEVEREHWASIDFDSLRYYKSGTTSFILLCRSAKPQDETGAKAEYVLKCVLFPWNKLTAIAKATDDYAANYGRSYTPAEVVVQPFASTRLWVLMPFQPGETLHEHLDRFEQGNPSAGARIEKAAEIGSLIITALSELNGDWQYELDGGRPVDPEHRERQHLDLSPSNIILAPGSNRIRFIDLGPNNLYSRQVGIIEHDDAAYVAPEIKNRGKSPVADVFSLGIILIRIICGYAPRDGRVPDVVWEISPAMGRLFEDLVEGDWNKRVLLIEAGQPFRYGPLREFLSTTFALIEAEPESSSNTWRRWSALLLPESRQIWGQLEKWRIAHALNAEGLSYERYLLIFSFIGTVCWWFVFAQTALFSDSSLATLHPNPLPKGVLLAADIICLAQGLIGAKFYFTILARLTVREIPGYLAAAAEVGIRAMAFISVPVTVVSVMWKPWLWAWAIAVGALVVAGTNWLALTLANRIYAAGQESELSIVPPNGRLGARGFEQWWWTMLLYAIVIGVIAFGLQMNWLHDTGAYVFGLTLISIGIHYIAKFVVAGYAVRGGLARAFAAAERMNILYGQGRFDSADWPPRLVNRKVREYPARLRRETRLVVGKQI